MKPIKTIKGLGQIGTNGSGYVDPIARKAIENASEYVSEPVNRLDDERYRKMIGLILRACELAGYSVEERIILKDKYTGKVYR